MILHELVYGGDFFESRLEELPIRFNDFVGAKVFQLLNED